MGGLCVGMSTRGSHTHAARGNGEMCLRDSNMCCVTFLFMTSDGALQETLLKLYKKLVFILRKKYIK